ncbi:hypothetical protein L1887_43431 [Cichorium endivia]|nr:hypothetical protein L1887_43431 [Cichorium endivia]
MRPCAPRVAYERLRRSSLRPHSIPTSDRTAYNQGEGGHGDHDRMRMGRIVVSVSGMGLGASGGAASGGARLVLTGVTGSRSACSDGALRRTGEAALISHRSTRDVSMLHICRLCARKLVPSLADAARASSKRKLSTQLRVYCNYPLAAAELGVWSRVMAVLALLVVHGQAFGSSASARCISQAAGLALPSELVSFPGSSGGRPGQLSSSLVSILASNSVPSSHKCEVDAVFAREGSSQPECEHLSLARSKAERQAALSVGGTGARDCFVLVSGWIPSFEHDTGASSAVRAAPTTIRWPHFGTSSALQRWQARAATVRQLAGSLGQDDVRGRWNAATAATARLFCSPDRPRLKPQV